MEGTGVRVIKASEETSGAGENVHSLDCGEGFTSANVYQNFPDFTL